MESVPADIDQQAGMCEPPSGGDCLIQSPRSRDRKQNENDCHLSSLIPVRPGATSGDRASGCDRTNAIQGAEDGLENEAREQPG
jgi:hypothetical protein